MKKRAAHVVYSYLPVTQNWIYSQIRCNRSYTHSVISLTEEGSGQFPWEPRYIAFPPGKMLNRLRLKLAFYWIRQPHAFFRSTVAKVRPDIIHGHFSTESWRVLPAARHLNVPLVTTFYGLDVDKLFRRRFWKRRYPELFGYGSRFFVEGPFMAERLAAIGCPGEKITVVSLGVDRDLYGSRKRPEAGAPVRILFVGLSREKKGASDAAEIFIHAVKEQRELELHIVGDGSCRSKLERMFAAAGVRGNVTFYGLVSFDRYREILAASDILLVPSCHAADGDSEGGAPVVCIEAQVAGLPVVGTRHCDIPHVVIDGSTGLLSGEHDTGAMTRDLLRLTGDTRLRRKMGDAGSAHASAQHDIHRQVEKIAEVYDEVIAMNRKERARNAAG